MKERIRHVNTGGTLGLVELTTLRDVGQIKKRGRTQNFRRADFHLFKELVYETLSETALRDKGTEQSSQLLRTFFLEYGHSQFPYVKNQIRKAGEKYGSRRTS